MKNPMSYKPTSDVGIDVQALQNRSDMYCPMHLNPLWKC